jgi:hypothetical protein
MRCVAQTTHRKIKITRFSWWIMTLVSPFWELAREMREMRYLYEMPHQISAAKFDRLLPAFVPTELREVMLAGLPTDIHQEKAVQPSDSLLSPVGSSI